MKGKIFFALIFSMSLAAKEKIKGIYYFNKVFGHIHANASKYSSSLTTVACGHPLKVINVKISSKGWEKVRVGDVKGHVLKNHLSEKRPDCPQSKYPKFFNQLELDLSEMHFWGRLYDQYIQGKSKAK